jgi:hypothetical protein
MQKLHGAKCLSTKRPESRTRIAEMTKVACPVSVSGFSRAEVDDTADGICGYARRAKTKSTEVGKRCPYRVGRIPPRSVSDRRDLAAHPTGVRLQGRAISDNLR